MDRRQVLKIGLASGFVIVAREALDAQPANAAKKSNIFYEGTVSGGDFDGWVSFFAKTKKSVRGMIFDPATAKEGPLVAFRARGSVGRNSTLEMNFFDLDDLEFTTPLGSCNGKATTKSLKGQFDLNKQESSIDSKAVKLSASKMRKFATTLESDVLDPSNGEIVATFQTVLSPNGSFTISQIETDVDLPVAVPNQVTGRWGLTANNEVWVVTLITPEVAGRVRAQGEGEGDLPTPSEVNKATILGDPDQFLIDLSLECVALRACLCGCKGERRR